MVASYQIINNLFAECLSFVVVGKCKTHLIISYTITGLIT